MSCGVDVNPNNDWVSRDIDIFCEVSLLSGAHRRPSLRTVLDTIHCVFTQPFHAHVGSNMI